MIKILKIVSFPVWTYSDFSKTALLDSSMR